MFPAPLVRRLRRGACLLLAIGLTAPSAWAQSQPDPARAPATVAPATARPAAPPTPATPPRHRSGFGAAMSQLTQALQQASQQRAATAATTTATSASASTATAAPSPPPAPTATLAADTTP